MSLINQFQIDIETQTWKRFPYLCSYCGSCPCACKKIKIAIRKDIIKVDKIKRPATLKKIQDMFRKIYPPRKRTLAHAGIHLAEEMGELSEAVLLYRSHRNEEDFKKVECEAADFFSCFVGVFNSLNVNIARELSAYYRENCHKCKKCPCVCTLQDILSFHS